MRITQLIVNSARAQKPAGNYRCFLHKVLGELLQVAHQIAPGVRVAHAHLVKINRLVIFLEKQIPNLILFGSDQHQY
jgi:hypothetical protein